MKNYLSVIAFCCLALFDGCKKEFSYENCLKAINPLPIPVGDSILYYQFTADNKNYQAIAYQNNFIVATTLGWDGITDRDSGSVIGSSLVQPNSTTFSLAPLTFCLQRGIVKNYSSLTQNSFQNLYNSGSLSWK